MWRKSPLLGKVKLDSVGSFECKALNCNCTATLHFKVAFVAYLMSVALEAMWTF